MSNAFNAVAANDNKPTQEMLDRSLLRAAEFDESEKITDLISRGADKNARHINGDTPLIIAAREGHDRTVRLMLRHRADMAARNNQNETAADAARRAGHGAIAKRIEDKIAAQTTQKEERHKDLATPIMDGSLCDIPTLTLPALRRRPKPAHPSTP
jgi:ankyrin repeat protein